MPALNTDNLNLVLRRYIVPSMVLIGIILAWDFTKPRMSSVDSKLTRNLPNSRVPRLNPNEKYFQQARDEARKSAQQALDQAWGTFCEPEGRKMLLDAVTYYFEQRRQQEKSYPRRFGQIGHNYITRQWSTPDDARIERLVEELYIRGYLRLEDMAPYIAKAILPLVKHARVTDQPCG